MPSVRAVCALALALALALNGCVGQAPATTPLDAPLLSDRGDFHLVLEVPEGFHRGANDFTVRVDTTAATSDATTTLAVTARGATTGVLTRVTGVMPLHGHDATPPVIEPLGDGRFAVRGLGLVMPGTWQIELSLSQTGGREDDRATILAEVE